jgi:hypothetical protein
MESIQFVPTSSAATPFHKWTFAGLVIALIVAIIAMVILSRKKKKKKAVQQTPATDKPQVQVVVVGRPSASEVQANMSPEELYQAKKPTSSLTQDSILSGDPNPNPLEQAGTALEKMYIPKDPLNPNEQPVIERNVQIPRTAHDFFPLMYGNQSERMKIIQSSINLALQARGRNSEKIVVTGKWDDATDKHLVAHYPNREITEEQFDLIEALYQKGQSFF